jgi:hypothetical protein
MSYNLTNSPHLAFRVGGQADLLSQTSKVDRDGIARPPPSLRGSGRNRRPPEPNGTQLFVNGSRSTAGRLPWRQALGTGSFWLVNLATNTRRESRSGEYLDFVN